MRFITAIKALFAVLLDREKAEQIILVLDGRGLLPAPAEKSEASTVPSFGEKESDKQTHPEIAQEQIAEKTPSSPPAAPKPPIKQPTESTVRQSDAITLLAALQREARFLDFIKEDLDSYEDMQVGAAARTVHDKSAAVIERFFDVQPLRSEEEASKITVKKTDIAFVQLIGDISGELPYTGQLTHHGWIARKCELPKWSGNSDAAFVLAPAEIEVE
ncbi:MAG: DUF2760 domain-containing protein [Planctomycetaceae bacterium]|jgi:hypothetical protein|nr:DUF2760 domain-containing protein [Planctomycetaceae bacterium]